MRWILSLLVALVAITLLALAGVAGANRLSMSEGEFAMQWVDNNNRLEFTTPGLPPVTCKFTMAGRFSSRTFAKTRGATIATVESTSVERSGATSGVCRNGEVTILTATLPWNISYQSFFGTLPRIRSVLVHIVNFSVRVSFEGSLICLFRSRTTEPVIGFIAVAPEFAGLSGPISPNGEIASEDAACNVLGVRLGLGGQGTFENRHVGGFSITLI